MILSDGDADFFSFTRFGRRILVGDTQGFVWVVDFPTEQEAKDEYEVYTYELAKFLGEDEG